MTRFAAAQINVVSQEKKLRSKVIRAKTKSIRVFIFKISSFRHVTPVLP